MRKIKTAILLTASLMLLVNVNISAQKSIGKETKRKTSAAKTAEKKTAGADKEKVKAPAFELEDQFNKKFSFKFPAKKLTVFIFGDRVGAEQIEDWARPLYTKYADKIEIYGIVELSSVPWIAKGIARNTIKSRSKNSVLLDWSGRVSKDYGSENEKANLFIVSPDGYIIAEKRGAATAAELEDLHKVIGDALK